MLPGRRTGSRGHATAAVLLFSAVGPCVADARGAAVVRSFFSVVHADVVALGTAATPPDAMGAAGLDEFVTFVNGAFAIHSKTGQRRSLVSDREFWRNAGIPPVVADGRLSDPRILFDPTVNRWFASEITVSNTDNQVLLARSDSADPAAGWKAVAYTAASGQFADYDTLGVDADRIYVGTNNLPSLTSSLFSGVTMSVIPKGDILGPAPTTANLRQFTRAMGTLGWTPQGVTNVSGASGPGSILAVGAGTRNRSILTPVTGVGADTALGSPAAITTLLDGSLSVRDPVQPGGTAVDGLDNRYSASVVQVGDLIYAANTVVSGTRNAVRWLVVSASTRTVAGEGIVADPAYDFFQPSIGVNAAGTFLLAFNRVGRTAGAGNLGVCAVEGTTSGTGISVGSPVLLHAGTVSNFTGPAYDPGIVKRWGDYSATTVDPTDPSLFWTIAEVPVSATDWGTRVIGVVVPEPGGASIVAAVAALAFIRAATGRRRTSPGPRGRDR